jgi:hypothetical protein
MFSTDYARRVLRTLDDRITSMVAGVAAGNASTLADYRETVGYIRGLRDARAALVEPLGRDADGLPPTP